MKHSELVGLDIHVPYLLFNNIQEREDFTQLGVKDLYKLALQKDDLSQWVLTGVSPIVWTKLSSDSGDRSFELGIARSFENPDLSDCFIVGV